MVLKSLALPLCITVAGLLLGCAGTATPPVDTKPLDPKPQPDKSKTPLSQVNFKDPVLRACVERLALKTIGEVTTLHCPGAGKSRLPGLTSTMVIRDLSGLEQLTYLKDLNLSGNFYTHIDVRSLVQLEELDLSSAFIKDLDVSKNTQLKSLNVTATAIEKLDTTGLKSLTELYTSFNGRGFLEAYTENELVVFGPSVGLTLAQVKNIKRDVILDPDVKLKAIETTDNTLTDVPYNNDLEVIKGGVTARSVSGATKLQKLSGHLSGSADLDLRPASQLTNVDIISEDITQLEIGAQVNTLSFDAPLTKLHLAENSQLISIKLNNIKLEGTLDTTSAKTLTVLDVQSKILNSVKIGTSLSALKFDGPLNSLSFPADAALNYMQLANLERDTLLQSPLPQKLTSISISNIYSKSINLDYLDKLTWIKLVGANVLQLLLPKGQITVNIEQPVESNTKIAPSESVAGLFLVSTDNGLCQFDTPYPNLKSLGVYGCKSSDTINLSQFPNLMSLTLSMPNLKSIAFKATPLLANISIYDTQVSDLDFSPFLGRSLGEFSFSGLLTPQAADKMEQDVSKIFNYWSLFFDGLDPIWGSRN